MLPVILPSDIVAWCIPLLILLAIRHVRRTPELVRRWRAVFVRPVATMAATVLGLFLLTALADSVHWRTALPEVPSATGRENVTTTQAWSPEVKSLLDVVIRDVLGAAGEERSYSAPFAVHEFDRTTVIRDGEAVRDFQPLAHAGKLPPWRTRWVELARLTLLACILGGVPAVLGWIFMGLWQAQHRGLNFAQGMLVLSNRKGEWLWRPMALVLT